MFIKSSNNSPSYGIEELLNIMTQLRAPANGCPWGLKQDFASIVKHTLEEAYEVADVIERGVLTQLPNELGDLLFQIVFYSQLAKEAQIFDFSDVVAAICSKLLRRHPDVFSEMTFEDETARDDHWHNDKEAQRLAYAQNAVVSLLDDIPLSMPALSRANKIQQRVAQHGFDWPTWHGCFDKVKEEIDEVEVELRATDVNAKLVAEELGDLMFAVVNLVRSQGLDPEQTLRHASAKFERRFRAVETVLLNNDSDTTQASLDEMEVAWQQVKDAEKVKMG